MTMGDLNQDKVIYMDEFRGPNKEVRVLSTFCYFPILGVFAPNFLDSILKNPNTTQSNLAENPFVRFHLTQAYVLFGIFLVSIFIPWFNFSLVLLLYLIFTGIHAYYARK